MAERTPIDVAASRVRSMEISLSGRQLIEWTRTIFHNPNIISLDTLDATQGRRYFQHEGAEAMRSVVRDVFAHVATQGDDVYTLFCQAVNYSAPSENKQPVYTRLHPHHGATTGLLDLCDPAEIGLWIARREAGRFPNAPEVTYARQYLSQLASQ